MGAQGRHLHVGSRRMTGRGWAMTPREVKGGFGLRLTVVAVLLAAAVLVGPLLTLGRPAAYLVAALVSLAAAAYAFALRRSIGPRWTWLSIALAAVWALAAGLCFVRGDWPLLSPPDSYRGVRLEGTRSIKKLVRSAQVLDGVAVDRLTGVLVAAFPAR